MTTETKVKQREWARLWWIANKAKYQERRRHYRESHEEDHQEYRDARREEQREYREAHRKEAVKWRRTWRENNKEQIREYQRGYRLSEAGKASRSAASAKHRATKLACTKGDRDAIAAVYKRARGAARVTCYLCGKPIPNGERQVDHVKPLSKDGAHSAENLAIVHCWCNGSKGTKEISELGLLL